MWQKSPFLTDEWRSKMDQLLDPSKGPPHKSSKMAKIINVFVWKLTELIRPLELQKSRAEPAGAQNGRQKTVRATWVGPPKVVRCGYFWSLQVLDIYCYGPSGATYLGSRMHFLCRISGAPGLCMRALREPNKPSPKNTIKTHPASRLRCRTGPFFRFFGTRLWLKWVPPFARVETI